MRLFSFSIFALFVLFSQLYLVEAKDEIDCIRNFRKIKSNFSFRRMFIGEKKDFGVGGFGTMSVKEINTDVKIIQLYPKEDLNFISFVDTLNGFIVGENGIIFSSKDGGKNWIKQNSNVKERLNSIFCLNKKHCWIVGNKGTILSTINSGENWTNLSLKEDKWLTSVSFISKETGWIVGAEGLVLQTIDSGKTWKEVQNIDFPKTNMLNENGTHWETIKFLSKMIGCFAGYNRIVCTSDGGKNWKKTEIDDSEESHYFIGFSTLNKYPIVLEQCGKDFISKDLGTTWLKN